MIKNIYRAVIVLSAAATLLGGSLCHAKNYILYVGTYTTGDSKGIYAYRYNGDTGELQSLGLVAETENPSFLTADAKGEHLFAVNEVQKYKGESSGGVSSFNIDRKSWKLSAINEVASHGADPCYISLDRTGRFALVANYTGGNVAVIPIAADGRLSDASSVVKDEGTLGPNKERQESPHAHWIAATARNRFVYVSDLGLDRVLIYKFDADHGTLAQGSSNQKDFYSATLAPGTGPRHVAFSSNGRFMYVLGEMDATVTVFSNESNEQYKAIQKVSGLPAGFSGENTAAEVVIHPNGKYLYTSNRGADDIAEFKIDSSSGKLTLVGQVPSGGKEPRNFALDPTGKRMLVANQVSGNIVEYDVDPATGKPSPNGKEVKVGAPVCLIFVEER